MNPLRQLDEFGQALWLDDIHRELITGGDLQRLIEEDGLRGMTSNPAIFNKAISDSADYDENLRALRGKGQSQSLLWASTSTKNPDYSDLKYVEGLIGPDTINTLPMETLEAYRDHGQGQPLLEENLVHARHVLEQLPKVGIDIDQATRQLEEEGIEKFRQSFDALLETLEKEIAV